MPNLFMADFYGENMQETRPAARNRPRTGERDDRQAAAGNRNGDQQSVPLARAGLLQRGAGNRGTNAALQRRNGSSSQVESGPQPRNPSSAATPSNGQSATGPKGKQAQPGDVLDGHVVYPDEVRKGGSLAWRNRNPGNIRAGSFATEHGAYKGKKNRGFAIFATEAAGMAAIKALLQTNAYKNLTILDAIKKYAPFDDSNNPVAYAASISKFTGLETKRKINSLNDAELGKVADAIKRVEGWKPGSAFARNDPKLPPNVRRALANNQTPGQEAGQAAEGGAAGRTGAGAQGQAAEPAGGSTGDGAGGREDQAEPTGKNEEGGDGGSAEPRPKNDGTQPASDGGGSGGGEQKQQAEEQAQTDKGKKQALGGSVGEGGENRPEDVRIVQTALKAKGLDPGKIDGRCGADTILAIKGFQQRFMPEPDGLIEPGKTTAKRLIGPEGPKSKTGGATQRKVKQQQAEVSPDEKQEQKKPVKKSDAKSADKGVPKAPATGEHWPIAAKRSRTIATSGGRSFKAKRSGGKRYHVGIDVYANNGDPVIACEDGTIVNFYHFYHGVNALLVQNKSGTVINYGEVAGDSLKRLGLKVGSPVKSGQKIAFVGKMSGGSSMLHFETYKSGTRTNQRWMVGKQLPKALLDPTEYLMGVSGS